MPKFQTEGYCPYNAVERKILEHGKSMDLWSMIGPSMVCGNDVEDTDAIVEMFTEDTIAKRLMMCIIRYAGDNTNKILIRSGIKGDCMQSYTIIQETLMSRKLDEAVLIQEQQSNFQVILSRDDEDTVVVTVFDLRRLI